MRESEEGVNIVQPSASRGRVIPAEKAQAGTRIKTNQSNSPRNTPCDKTNESGNLEFATITRWVWGQAEHIINPPLNKQLNKKST
jgi:hypothetical protein